MNSDERDKRLKSNLLSSLALLGTTIEDEAVQNAFREADDWRARSFRLEKRVQIITAFSFVGWLLAGVLAVKVFQ